MKRSVALAVSALSLATSGLMGFSATAQADARGPISQCVPDMKFCLFEHDNYKGNSWDAWTGRGCENIRSEGSYALNNKASSMSNGSEDRVRMYNDTWCAGAAGYSARPDSDDKDLTNNGFDNKASSIKS
ncbi:peptidase inhibitor family I36 protein [Streptomyces sp. 8N114]|uniref:peptidase inhibitor family I36 protein n=1 Tax=Streptomyces sp. 8N114 TaxID=3457419 RepID=UPI003FD107BB